MILHLDRRGLPRLTQMENTNFYRTVEYTRCSAAVCSLLNLPGLDSPVDQMLFQPQPPSTASKTGRCSCTNTKECEPGSAQSRSAELDSAALGSDGALLWVLSGTSVVTGRDNKLQAQSVRDKREFCIRQQNCSLWRCDFRLLFAKVLCHSDQKHEPFLKNSSNRNIDANRCRIGAHR